MMKTSTVVARTCSNALWAFTAAIVLVGLAGFSSTAQAITACSNVPSHEFSDNFDRNPDGSANPGNVLIFSCGPGVPAFGGAPTNSPKDFNPGQVDALAKDTDKFFTELKNNELPLILSVDGDPNIYYEETSGATGAWVFNAAVADVDGLEVWGDSIVSDYSLQGDPAGISLYTTSTVFPGNVTQAQILAGIQSMGIGLSLSAGDIDLDASVKHSVVGPNDELIFSVVPINDEEDEVILDGGEIFVLDLNTLTASFLDHGGHTWDTAFDVMGTFGVADENINAIEVVPEASTATLLGFGLLGLAARAVRARRGNQHCSQ